MKYSPGASFQQLLAEAIADIAATGYVSREHVEEWIGLLRQAAERDMGGEPQIDEKVRQAFGAAFKRLVDEDKVAKYVPGVSRFTIQMIKPQLRAELDRRILAAADLIKLNRKQAVEGTLQRLLGWSTSIPPGGDGAIDKREVRQSIGKSVAQFSYERRRVETDQSFKLVSNISEIVALDSGAIAGVWHDHGEHDKAYNARKEHLARDNVIFLVRDSWALQQGLIKLSGRKYADEVEKPGQLVFCRCWYTWITSPRRLPEDMITAKGREWIERGRTEAKLRMAA